MSGPSGVLPLHTNSPQNLALPITPATIPPGLPTALRTRPPSRSNSPTIPENLEAPLPRIQRPIEDYATAIIRNCKTTLWKYERFSHYDESLYSNHIVPLNYPEGDLSEDLQSTGV